jgi:hypothetical protein
LNDFVAPEDYVEVASGLLLVYVMGAVVGPIFESGVMAMIGPAGLFEFTAAGHGGLAVFAPRRMRVRVTPPEAERAAYAESILTAQTVAPMDPAAKSGEESRTAG